MDTPILFNPDNRLLAASTGDFGMYGGQSEPQFALRSAPSESGEDAAQTAPLPESSDEGGDSQSLSSQSAQDMQTPDAAAPQGSGAPASFMIASPAATAFHPVVAEPHDGVGATVTGFIPTAPGAGAPTPALPTADAPTQGGDTGATAAPIAEAMPDQVDTTVSQTAASVLETVTHATDGVVTGTAAPLLDSLAETTATATDLVVDTLAPVTDTILPLVTDTVSPLVDTTAGIASATISAVDDALDGLAGADPAGGVATLVSLVSVSDMFDLQPADAPLVDAAGDGFGMLDTLVGDELLPDTLLGGDHHDGGLLGDHDHPLGL